MRDAALEVEHGRVLRLQGHLGRRNGAQRGVDLLEDRRWRLRQLRRHAGVGPGGVQVGQAVQRLLKLGRLPR